MGFSGLEKPGWDMSKTTIALVESVAVDRDVLGVRRVLAPYRRRQLARVHATAAQLLAITTAQRREQPARPPAQLVLIVVVDYFAGARREQGPPELGVDEQVDEELRARPADGQPHEDEANRFRVRRVYETGRQELEHYDGGPGEAEADDHEKGDHEVAVELEHSPLAVF